MRIHLSFLKPSMELMAGQAHRHLLSFSYFRSHLFRKKLPRFQSARKHFSCGEKFGSLSLSSLRISSDVGESVNSDKPGSFKRIRETNLSASSKTTKSLPKAASLKTPPAIDGAPFAAITFPSLGLPELLVDRLSKQSMSAPTEVQSTAIPMIFQNHDVVIQSYTGSGKTLAYLLPILSTIAPFKKSPEDGDESLKKSGVEAVIVAPSRELGMQIVREVEKLLEPSEKKLVQQLVGGANRSRQEEALKKNKPLIVVGTPGRIAEISAAGKLHTHGCRFLVLDEVDQLLSPNFREDMHRILEHVGRRPGTQPAGLLGPLSRRSERQTIMVSATVPFTVIRAARSWGREPLHVRAGGVTSLNSASTATISSPSVTQGTVESLPPGLQHYYCLSKLQHKVDTLRRCVHALDAKSVMVFLNHSKRLKDVVFKLEARGLNAAELHGDLGKLERSTVLKSFKEGKLRLLVTNELSARGLDVCECDLVVNLDLPTDATHYAHRAGRTGRLGREGTVVTICEEPEVFVVKKFRRQLSVGIHPCVVVEGKLKVLEESEVE